MCVLIKTSGGLDGSFRCTVMKYRMQLILWEISLYPEKTFGVLRAWQVVWYEI